MFIGNSHLRFAVCLPAVGEPRSIGDRVRAGQLLQERPAQDLVEKVTENGGTGRGAGGERVLLASFPDRVEPCDLVHRKAHADAFACPWPCHLVLRRSVTATVRDDVRRARRRRRKPEQSRIGGLGHVATR